MGPVKKERSEDVLIDAHPDRFFKAWMDHPVLIPKLYADSVEKSTCLKGNHQAQGAAVEMVYPSGKPLFTKEYTCGSDTFQHTLVNYEKRLHKYETLEGELMDKCKFYKGTLEVVAHESGTKCIVKHEVEFETKHDTDPSFSSAEMERAASDYYHRVEQYLKANPTEYN
eukprot:TRINITY_DN33_c0_g1_i3.p2 TRINITY_DN33_c0_g1~~TRINITY_DN33_c0_g1_i3.p2  ORF type:complete len:169 (-),score=25.90 TRINITY_DN33_c0_g1_i3:275-781(-)